MALCLLGCSALLTSAACPSSNSTAANHADAAVVAVGTGASGAYWSGDPCSLLTNGDFATLSTPMTIASTDAHNVGSTSFSPECHFNLQGNGSSAAVAVFVDKASDFDLQKLVFQGTALAGLGKNAWQGDAGGQGNSTIDVLLAQWSYRVDSTYEYKYPDLKVLAAAIAGRLK